VSEPDGRAPLPPRDILAVLGDNTRYAIYLELVRSPRPLVTAEIADTLGLHPNTVRPHLERMREVGLVEVTADGRGEVGRPQHRYALSPDAPSLGLEPPTTPVLARMLLGMIVRTGASGADARAVGETEGAARAADFAAAGSALEGLVADLERLGFDPVVAADDDDADTAIVAFAHCPFAPYVATHPDIVCSLHHGMVEGFVTAMGDARVVEFCALADRTPCQVTLA